MCVTRCSVCARKEALRAQQERLIQLADERRRTQERQLRDQTLQEAAGIVPIGAAAPRAGVSAVAGVAGGGHGSGGGGTASSGRGAGGGVGLGHSQSLPAVSSRFATGRGALDLASSRAQATSRTSIAANENGVGFDIRTGRVV